MARKEPRKTTGGGKTSQSEKKSSRAQKSVGVNAGQEVQAVKSQESRPEVAPARVLTHDQIADRAKEVWQQRGCPHGQDEYIWHEAERQLMQEVGMQ